MYFRQIPELDLPFGVRLSGKIYINFIGLNWKLQYDDLFQDAVHITPTPDNKMCVGSFYDASTSEYRGTPWIPIAENLYPELVGVPSSAGALIDVLTPWSIYLKYNAPSYVNGSRCNLRYISYDMVIVQQFPNKLLKDIGYMTTDFDAFTSYPDYLNIMSQFKCKKGIWIYGITTTTEAGGDFGYNVDCNPALPTPRHTLRYGSFSGTSDAPTISKLCGLYAQNNTSSPSGFAPFFSFDIDTQLMQNSAATIALHDYYKKPRVYI